MGTFWAGSTVCVGQVQQRVSILQLPPQPRPVPPRMPPPQAQLKGMPWHMHRPQSQKPTGVRTVMLILANAGVAARPCPVKNQSVRQARPLCKQGVVAASKSTTTWCRGATQNQGIVQPGLSPTLLRRQQFQLFSWSCLLCACCDALEIDICKFLCDFCNCKYLLCLLCTVSYCTEQFQCTLRAWVWLEDFQLSLRSSLKCLLHFDIFLSLFATWVRLQCLAFLSRLLFCLAARTKPRWTCRAARLSHLIPWEKAELLCDAYFEPASISKLPALPVISVNFVPKISTGHLPLWRPKMKMAGALMPGKNMKKTSSFVSVNDLLETKLVVTQCKSM